MQVYTVNNSIAVHLPTYVKKNIPPKVLLALLANMLIGVF